MWTEKILCKIWNTPRVNSAVIDPNVEYLTESSAIFATIEKLQIKCVTDKEDAALHVA